MVQLRWKALGELGSQRKGSDGRYASRHGESVEMAVILVVEDDVFIREVAEMMIELGSPDTFGRR